MKRLNIFCLAESMITKTFEKSSTGPSPDCEGTCCHFLPCHKDFKQNKKIKRFNTFCLDESMITKTFEKSSKGTFF